MFDKCLAAGKLFYFGANVWFDALLQSDKSAS